MRWCNCVRDNKLGTLFNMVGFQTKLKHGEQLRIFPHHSRPAKRRVRAARRLHRNTFLNSPKLLDETLRLKCQRALALCGQFTVARAMWNPPAIGGLARALPPPSGVARRLSRRRDDRARRAAGAYHRRPYRDHRCRPLLVPADERQFRFVSSAQ